MPNRDTVTDVSVDADPDHDDDTTLSITTRTVREWTVDDLWSEPVRSSSPADKRLVMYDDGPFGWGGYELRDGEIYDVSYNRVRNKYDREKQISRETFNDELEGHVVDAYVGDGEGDFATYNTPP